MFVRLAVICSSTSGYIRLNSAATRATRFVVVDAPMLVIFPERPVTGS